VLIFNETFAESQEILLALGSKIKNNLMESLAPLPVPDSSANILSLLIDAPSA
jgi:hypothetical protein